MGASGRLISREGVVNRASIIAEAGGIYNYFKANRAGHFIASDAAAQPLGIDGAFAGKAKFFRKSSGIAAWYEPLSGEGASEFLTRAQNGVAMLKHRSKHVDYIISR